MDFIQLIENNACLKAYFTEFPKKLKKLACEGNMIKFSEKKIEVDPEQLGEYLASNASIFPIKTVMDFFETLHVLQFRKTCSTRNKISYFFVHPKFGKNSIIFDDFYKEEIDMNIKELKNTKRMSPIHYIELFDRLIRMNNTKKIKISRLEFTRLKLQYVLQRKIDLIKYAEDVVDHNIEEPAYTKNNEIAGYYGNVEIDTLKKVFCNYFPIYQTSVEEPMDIDPPTVVTQAVEQLIAINQANEQPVDTEMPNEHDPASQDIIVDVCSLPEVRKYEEPMQSKVIDDEDKENQPPPKKKRRCKTFPGKISTKETNDALTFLENEVGAMSSNI
ncbi:unnamed protein product [Chironomus riparius]|uniref:Uncharacterized protein n=1 Tax=Chironomus riparius TaxID=315576 RepID=A0A9N9WQG6_9DIPT|nr:unnamed protein product [Chironomus riparius]